MIDKKVLLLVSGLIVVAMVVLAVTLISPATTRGGGGSSFTALFDNMERKSVGSSDLVLPSTYITGQAVLVTDTIMAMEIKDLGLTTRMWFTYVGDTWANETAGTDFNVLEDTGKIVVDHAMFYIDVSGDWHLSLDVGKAVTLQSVVKTSNDNHQVLGRTWVIIL